MDTHISIISIVIPCLLFLVIVAVSIIAMWTDLILTARIETASVPRMSWLSRVGMGGILYTALNFFRITYKNYEMDEYGNIFLRWMMAYISILSGVIIVSLIPLWNYATFQTVVKQSHIFGINCGVPLAFAAIIMGNDIVILLSSIVKGRTISDIKPFLPLIVIDIILGVAFMAIIISSNTLNIGKLIASQAGGIENWNAIRHFPSFILAAIWLFTFNPLRRSSLWHRSMFEVVLVISEYARSVAGALLIAAIFLGGWQIPYISMLTLNSYLQELVVYIGPFVGLMLAVFGGVMANGIKRDIYSDIRDYERRIWGGGIAVCGLLLLIISLYYEIAEIPNWIRWIALPILQFVALLAKTALLYVLTLMLRKILSHKAHKKIIVGGATLGLFGAAVDILIALFRKGV